MNYNPSIASRSTDELLEIVSNIEDWNEDAVLVAQDELIKRGIKSDKQSFLKDITTKAKTKKSSIKENASYPPVSYTHLRAHETVLDLVCRLLLEKKKKV